ncbi:hypothetical protein QQX09_13385 [Demequina sp. SYSU T00192]|uniref:Uncharacterized protein n=1 Tax=Demequina litoralis TaxID=3051660 RepID=A0ABT8GCI4_9MICO|nr:hypothetical protein [Demequina sp. SYSU T00192]MDN4476846.1 hypothetical protein [Demequina sp. SYSU T00192]
MTTIPRTPLAMSVPLAVLAAIASGAGALAPDLYAGDRESFAVQAAAQDWVTLLVAVPALLALALAARRGSRAAWLAWHGAVLYLAYTYAVACFMVQFNPLFLVYTSTFGLAFLTLATSLATAIRDTPADAFGPRWSRRTTAGVLWAVAAVFALLWLSDIAPALLAGATPDTLAESGTPTNGVEVLDLSIMLPTLALTGAWLLRRRVRGYVLATAALTFTALLGLALVAMVIGLVSAGLAESAAPAIVFGLLAAGAGVLAVLGARATSDSGLESVRTSEIAVAA